MAEIQKRSPDLKMPSEVNWEKFNLNSGDEEAILVYALDNTPLLSKKNWEALPSEYRDTIQALLYSRQKNYVKAIDSFSHLHFLHYPDPLHLNYGRALYAIQYEGAIGVAMQLRSGVLRNTFSPEPIMVAAMAFNELCQFQDSIRMVNAFVHDYSPTFDWLNKNKDRNDLYSEVMRTMKRTKSEPANGVAFAPPKITSEWIKGATFLTRQNEINRLIKEPDHLKEIQALGAHEQTVMTEKILKDMKDFIHDVKIAELKLKPGEEIAESFGARYLPIKKDLRQLKNFYRASRTWAIFSKNFEKKIPKLRAALVEKINLDLKKHQTQMLSLLDKVRENSDLIEVEIYSGASKDMIWKNAHPDYDENQKLTQNETDQKNEKTNSAKYWNWGRFLASDIESAEVWEDEMGSLKADLSDQCQKKEKYLNLKMKKRDAP